MKTADAAWIYDEIRIIKDFHLRIYFYYIFFPSLFSLATYLMYFFLTLTDSDWMSFPQMRNIFSFTTISPVCRSIRLFSLTRSLALSISLSAIPLNTTTASWRKDEEKLNENWERCWERVNFFWEKLVLRRMNRKRRKEEKSFSNQIFLFFPSLFSLDEYYAVPCTWSRQISTISIKCSIMSQFIYNVKSSNSYRMCARK